MKPGPQLRSTTTPPAYPTSSVPVTLAAAATPAAGTDSGSTAKSSSTPTAADTAVTDQNPFRADDPWPTTMPDAVLSVDTYRPDVARMVVEEYGADIINDVSEGGITGIVDTPLQQSGDEYPAIFRMMGRLKVPYILMSVQGNLHDMLIGFAREVQQLRDLGVKDIILDPGFGFGKTTEENFKLLDQMDRLSVLELPLLAGVSRKRMIFQTLGITPDEALNGTTVINTMALMRGADILRVHDVREAVQAVRLSQALKSA